MLLFVSILGIGWKQTAEAGIVGDWVKDVTEEQDTGC
jgi:hypothetical protein